MKVRRSLIVELEDDRGTMGIGEAAPFEEPFYSEETFKTVGDVLREQLLPAVVGSTFDRIEEVHDAIEPVAPRSPMARAGVETAWWDLVAHGRKSSLRKLVGERFNELGVRCAAADAVPCGVALGIPDDRNPEALLRDVAAALEGGYHRVKVKVDREWHVEAVAVTRRAMQLARDDRPITVDANGAFDPEQDREILRELDALGLLYIEQPYAAEQAEAIVELAGTMATPICLDESLPDEPTARFFGAQAGRWVWNVKVQRVGGLESACRIAAMARDATIPLWVGTMPESGIGAQATLALAAHDVFTLPTDVEPSERWYAAGTDPVALTMDSDGMMSVPTMRPEVETARFPMVFELDAGA